MFYKLLMEWLNDERFRATTSYEQNTLRDFAMWLDSRPTQRAADGATGCAVCGSTNPQVHFTEPHRFTGTPRR